MKTLAEFTTVAEARAYTFTKYSKITVGQAGQYFGLTGMLDALEASQSNTTVLNLSATMSTTVGALCRTILNSAKTSGFACDPSTEDGASNRGAAQLLLSAGVFPDQGIVDGFWAKGETVVTPYADVSVEEFAEAKDLGETLVLNGNAGQHTARINITTQPVKPFNIDIEHRYGPDAGNLTEWHTIGAFRGVDYTQRAYECNIPKSPAVYRELRAVSKVSVGMYLPVYPPAADI